MSYDLIASNGNPVWIPGIPAVGVQSYSFKVPAAPTEIIITHAAQMGRLPGPDLSAHFSATAGDMGVINPQKVGNAESIIAACKNTHLSGSNAAPYLAPNSTAYLNVCVAANNRQPATPVVTFGLLSDLTPLSA